jgi:glycosyltransferase involved in cell wall biosynthesis
VPPDVRPNDDFGDTPESVDTARLVPAASVVIPTRNRASHLEVCLRGLLHQTLDEAYEIIIIDDGSEDATYAVTERARSQAPERVQVRYKRLSGDGINTGRNRGAALAKAELVCLVDDDVDPPPTWLAALVGAAREHPEAGALGGPIRLRIEGREPRHCRQDHLPETRLDRGPSKVWDRKLFGANLAFRKEAYGHVGPFAENMGVGDEEEWEDRLLAGGGHTLYVPEAGLWHRRTPPELTRRYLMLRSYRIGYSHVPYQLGAGQHITFLSQGVRAIRGLGHALLFRCFYGFLRACRHWGAIRRLWDLRHESSA